MNLEVQQSFFDDHKARFSSETSRSYKIALNQFFAFCEKNYDEVKATDIRAWLAFMGEQGLKPRTIHLKLSAIKSFYQYCMEENKTKKNPTLTVHTPKKDDSLPYYWGSGSCRIPCDIHLLHIWRKKTCPKVIFRNSLAMLILIAHESTLVLWKLHEKNNTTVIKSNEEEGFTMEKHWEITTMLPNKENQAVVGDFLLHLKLANRSEATIYYYKRFLVRFFGDMEEAYYMLSSERILRWFQENRCHLKESTYRLHMSIISSFYNFCMGESLVERSPIKNRWFPRLAKAVPKSLEKGEIAKVRQVSERISLRNQLIVEFMLTSGCRVGEVHRLNLENVDLENRTARVVGKGKKIRNVHFSEKCAILFERYLDNRQETVTSPLFISFTTGTRLSIQRIQQIIKEIGEKAGLSTILHSHRLRHSFATNLLAKGADLSFISDELGHSNLNTTQIYARLPNQVIVSQYRKFMG
jgi:site-specific recombinase XerD